MAENGSILVTGAAGQLGAVGRTVTGLLLDRGLPVYEKYLHGRCTTHADVINTDLLAFVQKGAA